MWPWELLVVVGGLAFVAGWATGVGGALASMDRDQARRVERELFLYRARRAGV